jgi:hypothetical protein
MGTRSDKPDQVKGVARHMSQEEVLELTGWTRWTLRRKSAQYRFPPKDPDTGGFRTDWIRKWEDGKRDWRKEADALRLGTEAPPPVRHKAGGGSRRPA